MSSEVLSRCTFTTEALNVILREVEKANAGGYDGVGFEGRRDGIWIFYARGLSTYMGQEQKHPANLWADMCLAMRLLGRCAHRLHHPGLVRLSEEVGPYSSRWTIYSSKLGQDALTILDTILRRVDETMTLLDSPLSFEPSV